MSDTIEVEIKGWAVNTFLVKHKGKEGYMPYKDFDHVEKVDSLYKAVAEQSPNEVIAYLEAEILLELTKSYGKTTALRILDHEYWIGMTKAMAQISLGTPEDINRTVTTNYTDEQWVYGKIYLYFRNGVCTSFQD